MGRHAIGVATWLSLENCSGSGVLYGYGQDNGYGTGVLGPAIRFAASGSQTIRVQTREDGFDAKILALRVP
jgi:hypothetical protein